MTQLYANNATATLSAAITASDTTINVATDKSYLFPACEAPHFFKLTLENALGQKEIVHCVSRTVGSGAMTVERQKEGTTALPFPVGTLVELRWTAEDAGNLATMFASLQTSIAAAQAEAANASVAAAAAQQASANAVNESQAVNNAALLKVDGVATNLTLAANASVAMGAVTKQQLDTAVNNLVNAKLDKENGTATGLKATTNATDAMGLVTKQQMDAAILQSSQNQNSFITNRNVIFTVITPYSGSPLITATTFLMLYAGPSLVTLLRNDTGATIEVSCTNTPVNGGFLWSITGLTAQQLRAFAGTQSNPSGESRSGAVFVQGGVNGDSFCIGLWSAGESAELTNGGGG